jgi:hypothetical protein
MASIFDPAVRYEEKMVRFLREGNLGEYEGIRLQEHPQMQLLFNGGARIGSCGLVKNLFEIWLEFEGEIRFDTTLFHEFPALLRANLSSPLMQPGAVSEGRLELERKKLEMAEQGVFSHISVFAFSSRCCDVLKDGDYKEEIVKMLEIAWSVLTNVRKAKFEAHKANF